MRSAVDRTHSQHGRLDLLVNCIGIQREELLADVSEEKFDEIYRVNVKAAMFVAQACARHQVAAGAAARRCICFQYGRNWRCADAATRRTARPRARWSC